MSTNGKRMLLPKRLRAASLYNTQKFSKDASILFSNCLETSLKTILKMMRELHSDVRNISPDLLLSSISMLCLENDTIEKAVKANEHIYLVRPTTVYRHMKNFFPSSGVRLSTTRLLTKILNCLAEELVHVTKLQAEKSRRKILTERDIQIACLNVENICILLNGRNDAAYIPKVQV